jgi:PTS system nitrogen regulatory IIA component
MNEGVVPMQGEDRLLTTEEVAEYLRVTPKTVREWIQRGELEAIDVGQGYRIFKRDLDAFIERRRRRKGRKK